MLVKYLVEHGACIYARTFSDGETPAQKCEEHEPNYAQCSQYLYGKLTPKTVEYRFIELIMRTTIRTGESFDKKFFCDGAQKIVG